MVVMDGGALTQEQLWPAIFRVIRSTSALMKLIIAGGKICRLSTAIPSRTNSRLKPGSTLCFQRLCCCCHSWTLIIAPEWNSACCSCGANCAIGGWDCSVACSVELRVTSTEALDPADLNCSTGAPKKGELSMDRQLAATEIDGFLQPSISGNLQHIETIFKRTAHSTHGAVCQLTNSIPQCLNLQRLHSEQTWPIREVGKQSAIARCRHVEVSWSCLQLV